MMKWSMMLSCVLVLAGCSDKGDGDFSSGDTGGGGRQPTGEGGADGEGGGDDVPSGPKDGEPCTYTVPSPCDCTYDFCDPSFCETCCNDTTAGGVYCGGVCQSSCNTSPGGDTTTEEGSGEGGGSSVDSSTACLDACQDLGFQTGEVVDDTCYCDVPTDYECELGMEAICVCQDGIDELCTDEMAFNLYVNCHQDNDGAREIVVCVGSFVDDDYQIDCDAAVACF